MALFSLLLKLRYYVSCTAQQPPLRGPATSVDSTAEKVVIVIAASAACKIR